MWDINNPSRVTLIKSRTGLQYDLVTRGIKTDGDVQISIENTPNTRTQNNRTLVLPEGTKQ
jgi:hypothetical protein